MPNFFFQRYVNGERMADDVLITKQQTLEAAIPEALRLCRNSPRSVLVHIADDSALREENARLRAVLKPFVDAGHFKVVTEVGALEEHNQVSIHVKESDLRAAAAAIREGGGDE